MRRRNDFEHAKLQDENIALAEKAHRQQATLSAHLRFSQRANDSHRNGTSNVKSELELTQQELSDMESNYAQTQVELQKAHSKVRTLSEQLVKVEHINATAATTHTGELSEICLTWEQERKKLHSLLTKKSHQLVEAECRVVEMEKTLDQKNQDLERSFHHQSKSTESPANAKEEKEKEKDAYALKETLLKSNQEVQCLRDQLRSTNKMVENLTREIGIKDKQLDHLRGQLSDITKTGGPSFLSMAIEGASKSSSTVAETTPPTSSTTRTSKEEAQEELIEILEEDMKEMRLGYEKRISELEVKLEERRPKR